jgi:phage/plasmid primase-like uncharacterized protein
MTIDEKTRKRWQEMKEKFKYNSCDEADQFWDGEWTTCPVCGAHGAISYPPDGDAYLILLHKDPKLIQQ